MSITPSAFSGSCVISVGGTAQELAASSEVATGGVIKNPLSAIQQNISQSESLFVNFVATATLAAGGTTIELEPGVSISLPGATTVAVSVAAATAGHQFSAYKF
jgi:hypothetical protein